MVADLSALDPARRAWFESKQAMIHARDAWICMNYCCTFWWPWTVLTGLHGPDCCACLISVIDCLFSQIEFENGGQQVPATGQISPFWLNGSPRWAHPPTQTYRPCPDGICYPRPDANGPIRITPNTEIDRPARDALKRLLELRSYGWSNKVQCNLASLSVFQPSNARGILLACCHLREDASVQWGLLGWFVWGQCVGLMLCRRVSLHSCSAPTNEPTICSC
jgi:hypothetical protein